MPQNGRSPLQDCGRFCAFYCGYLFSSMEQAGSLLRKIRECIAEFFGKLLDRRTAIAIDRNSGWVAKWHIIALEAGIAISVKVQRPARYDYLLQIWAGIEYFAGKLLQIWRQRDRFERFTAVESAATNDIGHDRHFNLREGSAAFKKTGRNPLQSDRQSCLFQRSTSKEYVVIQALICNIKFCKGIRQIDLLQRRAACESVASQCDQMIRQIDLFQ